MKLLLTLVFVLCLQGCVPVSASGGGSVYYPPISRYYSQPYYSRPSLEFRYGFQQPYYRPPIVLERPYYNSIIPRWEHYEPRHRHYRHEHRHRD